MMRSRSVRWLASLSAAVLLLPGCDATENTIPETTLAAATTTTPATTTTSVPATTASETTTTTAAPTTMPATQNGTEPALAPIGATWSYLGTVDDFLTEPGMMDGRYYATRKGLHDDTQEKVDGQVEGFIELGGELLTSSDGLTWMIAEEADWPPPASSDTAPVRPAVVVRRSPIGDQYGVLVADGLWATSDGTSWREIPLPPSQNNWVPEVTEGGLGWVIFSPPMEATVEADASSLFQGPRHENLGLWYTPDTEEWFQVADLGPLADVVGETVDHDGEIIVVASDGEVGVMGAAMIVRDTDILVYVNIAEAAGWYIRNPHTEIWRLELSPWEPAQGFDFSTQSLCDWFSPNDIDAIVTSTYEAVGVTLNAGGEMSQRQDQNSDCFWSEPLVTLSEYDAAFTWDGGPFEPHSALDDSVLVSIRSPGSYGLMHGVDALLKVDGHGAPLSFGHSTGTYRVDVETINTLGLTIANEMLKEMGWIEAGSFKGAVPVEWDPILATTKAKAAPLAATCPTGTDPNVPGLIDQARPEEGPWNNQAAVFDTRQGRIVYLDEAGETWTFDVCTNTWHAMNPTGAPYGDWTVSREFGELVYDIDSDRTIAFGPYYVSVYDANTNSWTQQTDVRNSELTFGWPGFGAVYDPVSGLVIVQTEEGLVAYDVDTDTWTQLGQLSCSPNMVYDAGSEQWSPADPVPDCTPFLIGHSTGSDELIFLGFQDGGLLVDPRTGTSTYLDAPPGGVTGGFGSFRYATSGDTAYTHGERVCRLDSVAFDWDCVPRSDPGSVPAAMVYDPINTRVVAITDWCCTWPGSTVSNDVSAIDMDTGERIELLAENTDEAYDLVVSVQP